jgi:hypothetical protein
MVRQVLQRQMRRDQQRKDQRQQDQRVEPVLAGYRARLEQYRPDWNREAISGR